MYKKVQGVDVNALYLSTMRQCGKEVVSHYTKDHKLEDFIEALKGSLGEENKWFGFADVDIEVPAELWEKFEEVPPLFYNKAIQTEAVLLHMKKYLTKCRCACMPEQKNTSGGIVSKDDLYEPLLK